MIYDETAPTQASILPGKVRAFNMKNPAIPKKRYEMITVAQRSVLMDEFVVRNRMSPMPYRRTAMNNRVIRTARHI
jgi:hypothetical protein